MDSGRPPVTSRDTPAQGTAHDRAVADLLGRIKNWQFRDGTLLRASVPLPPVDPLLWLQAHEQPPRCYWRNRDHTLTLAGLGSACTLEARSEAHYAAVLHRINTLIGDEDAFFVGGVSFDGRPGREAWARFPAALFVLPAIELRQDEAGCRLAVNLWAESQQAFMREKTRLITALCQLRFDADPPWEPPVRISRREDHMDFPACAEHIGAILERIAGGSLRKAVLARRVQLHLDTPLPVFTTLRRLRAGSTDSFCFALERDGQFYMGCSPERLFSRIDRHVCTESLAGTVRRGETPEEDRRLERLLLDDPKLVHEHELVTRYVHDQIAPWVTRAETPEHAGVVKLDRIQHRYLPLCGTLRPGVMDEQLLRTLHPTPAVCGFPRREARELILEREPVPRGWYSGTVGVVSPRHSEFAVAIRSALVEGNRMMLYSGVGIVDGSRPEAEWNELEAKLETLLCAVEN
ncbi:isochorismate synthase [Ectothiorhodospira mobilis]|uniref:Isochorismate synthase MenF n=1 Tax=Ectothiorhodospira mobilis TaxID=195064 RepID=A0A1I4SLG8_ECTMO|nr:isochorismate synthase [Ectothiorhodospira mobilis]SFM65272.1 isochorismate synthase [Ectothiorhodospira mobilis]